MASILGIGECMVELSPAGQELWQQSYAGDVYNALWYARAALPEGHNVSFHTALGTDQISDDMLAAMTKAGIDCADTPRIDNRSPGLYAIHLKDGERSFSYWRDTSAARSMMKDAEALWRKVAQADMVFFSGITLAILPPEDVATLLSGIRSHLRPGARIAFDPNIRPRLWADTKTMLDTITEAARIADIVLPSFDDETTAFGDASPDETVARYSDLGVKLVVVKDGEGPTLVMNDGTKHVFDVPNVANVVDTTAAGDSFAGTFLANLMMSDEIEMAIRAAQRCAGVVIGHRGALVDHGLIADFVKPQLA